MKRVFYFTLLLTTIILSAVGSEEPVPFQRTEDVIYGRKHGVVLSLDVFQPAKTNGYGILFMVSGGFYSSHEAINAKFYQPFLDRGYTVFAVVHGSQPKYHIPEIVQDIHRAVRFVRHNAARYGINPNRLGITGASAGGHLSLTLATQGTKGIPEAKDPIDRESSVVQAAACFFPPTDFLNYGEPGVDAVGVGPLKAFYTAFGPKADTAESRKTYGREISPYNFITTNLPPVLIIHGDADRLVPIQQAEIFVKRAQELDATAKLVVRPGKDHGWADMLKDLDLFADWFDEHLRGLKPKNES